MAGAIPGGETTLHATVWRGSSDDEAEAVAMDHQDRPGQVWIAFLRGEDPSLASKFRERAIREIMLRWPATLSLPILPTGAIPLHYKLVRVPGGYIVNPSEARKYALDATEKQPH